jgi:hypothetical protein
MELARKFLDSDADVSDGEGGVHEVSCHGALLMGRLPF